MNQSKLKPFLQSNDVLGANGIRSPQRFVEVFTVPTTKLGSAVIDVIKRPRLFEYAFELTEFTYIAASVERCLNIGPQAEADLIGLMGEVTRHNMVAPAAKLAYQSGANGA